MEGRFCPAAVFAEEPPFFLKVTPKLTRLSLLSQTTYPPTFFSDVTEVLSPINTHKPCTGMEIPDYSPLGLKGHTKCFPKQGHSGINPKRKNPAMGGHLKIKPVVLTNFSGLPTTHAKCDKCPLFQEILQRLPAESESTSIPAHGLTESSETKGADRKRKGFLERHPGINPKVTPQLTRLHSEVTWKLTKSHFRFNPGLLGSNIGNLQINHVFLQQGRGPGSKVTCLLTPDMIRHEYKNGVS